MNRLEDINLSNRRVLIRVDVDLRPLDREKLTSEKRLRRILPTILKVLELGGRPILLAHISGPDGKVLPSFSLKPVAEKLDDLLPAKVQFAPTCVGAEVEQMAAALPAGQVLMLENLRFHPGEKSNDLDFSRQLARVGEVFINDAFSTTHRLHASIVGVPKLIQEKAAGLRMQDDVTTLERLLPQPSPPVCVIIGGKKASSKMGALLNLAKAADKLVIGGALANTFLAAQGMQMGRSVYEPELFPQIMEVLGVLARRECKTYLPVDFRIGKTSKSKGIARSVPAQEVPPDTMALDIGPASSLLFDEVVTNAGTIIWNGPLGAFENEEYAEGTTGLIQSLANAHGLTVAGGMDTETAIRDMELEHKFDHISSGGEAFLAILEGRRLPGITALRG